MRTSPLDFFIVFFLYSTLHNSLRLEPLKWKLLIEILILLILHMRFVRIWKSRNRSITAPISIYSLLNTCCRLACPSQLPELPEINYPKFKYTASISSQRCGKYYWSLNRLSYLLLSFVCSPFISPLYLVNHMSCFSLSFQRRGGKMGRTCSARKKGWETALGGDDGCLEGRTWQLKMLKVLLEMVFLPLKKGSWLWELVNSGQQVRWSREAKIRGSKWKTNTVKAHGHPHPTAWTAAPCLPQALCGSPAFPSHSTGRFLSSLLSWVLFGREVEWLLEAKWAASAFTSTSEQPNLPLQISCLLKWWVSFPWIR